MGHCRRTAEVGGRGSFQIHVADQHHRILNGTYPVTVAEYMDHARFPLTTQGNLEPQNQMMIDAFNYDDLSAVEEEGREMTPGETARWEELKVKRAAMPEVSAELKRQESGS